MIDKALLPLINAEKILVSHYPCVMPTVEKQILKNAEYEYGNEDFSEEIKNRVSGIFRGRKWPNGSVTLMGEVNEKGALVNLIWDKNDLIKDDLMRLLTMALRRLPLLKPATVDGKPTTQRFSINFSLNGYFYSFSYNFTAITIPPR